MKKVGFIALAILLTSSAGAQEDPTPSPVATATPSPVPTPEPCVDGVNKKDPTQACTMVIDPVRQLNQRVQNLEQGNQNLVQSLQKIFAVYDERIKALEGKKK